MKYPTLFLAFLVLLGACKELDQIPPDISNKDLSFSEVEGDSITVSWAASDDPPFDSNVEYRLYYATKSGQLNSTSNITSGDLAGNTGSSTSLTVKGLDDGTNYWFNVLATDEAGNEAVYNETNQATLDETPPVPGDSGRVGVKVAASLNGTDYDVYIFWAAATDNFSDQENLEYRIFATNDSRIFSATTDAEAIAAVIAYDTFGGSWQADITMMGMGTYNEVLNNYPYAVLAVRDEAANEAYYTGESYLANASGSAPQNLSDPLSGLQMKRLLPALD